MNHANLVRMISLILDEATAMAAIYAASKAAAEVLCQSAAAQLKEHKIRVNIVRPGFTLPSEMVAAAGPVEEVRRLVCSRFVEGCFFDEMTSSFWHIN